jgi:Rps23 Pro-64 3,4-dihydroxylase Tpa1-like proline 4-hydroxylase
MDCEAEVCSGMIDSIFANSKISDRPFRHVRIPTILSEEQAGAALDWFECRAPWSLRVADFYEQDEFSLLATELSETIKFLVEPMFLRTIRQAIQDDFGLPLPPTLIDVNAHKLTQGQTIRIHNDYIEGEETHRLLIQLNRGWTTEQGGLLMLFSGPAPEDVYGVILPRHRTGLAFEISPYSFHAVSQIKCGERYTLVYSFRASS